MALVSTSRVLSLIARAGSSPVIFPAVCSAMTRLISARAASGASAKPTYGGRRGILQLAGEPGK